MATIEILGIPHRYDLTTPVGSGPTLVFLHGWLLSRHYWQPLMQHLAPDYRCLAYDLRGFGDSELLANQGLNGGYTPRSYANDLVVLLQQLGIEQVWVIGHSLGGTIALWAAREMPDQVQGVICVNSGGGIYLREDFERFRQAGQQLVRFRPPWLARVPWLGLAFARISVAQTLEPHWGRQRLLDFLGAHPEAALGSLLDSTTEAEVQQLPEIVAQLPQSVYFFAGIQDPIMPPQYVRYLASFHQLFGTNGDNVIALNPCGHFAMLEQTALVQYQIRRILRRHVPEL